MTSKDIQAALSTPEILKLKQIGAGLEVEAVWGDRVLVEDVEPETYGTKLERQGLVFMPQDAKDKSKPKASTGIIIQVGEGVPEHERAFIKEGAMIMFSKYSGESIIIDEREGLRILQTRDIAIFLRATEAVIAPIARETPA